MISADLADETGMIDNALQTLYDYFPLSSGTPQFAPYQIRGMSCSEGQRDSSQRLHNDQVKAKYQGYCRRCRFPIISGDTIERNPETGQWEHADCKPPRDWLGPAYIRRNLAAGLILLPVILAVSYLVRSCS